MTKFDFGMMGIDVTLSLTNPRCDASPLCTPPFPAKNVLNASYTLRLTSRRRYDLSTFV